MTAYPDPVDFANIQRGDLSGGVSGRSNVVEEFWGYEIRPREQIIDVAVLSRLAIAFLGVALVFAGLEIWFLSSGVLGSAMVLKKLLFSMGFIAGGSYLVANTAIGGRVSLQVDVNNGELREVARSLTGRTLVLSSYGFDAVEGIDLKLNGKKSQILVNVRGVGPIPAGDGNYVVLGGLKSRLAEDLGVQSRSETPPAEFVL